MSNVGIRPQRTFQVNLGHTEDRQCGTYNSDEILKCISLNEKCHIVVQMLQKFVSMGPINN